MARPTASRSLPDPSFVDRWNSLDKDHRKQIRRLVRVGRPQENPADAALAVGFADHQRTRLWYRLFWLWFPVLVLGGLYAAMSMHPLVVGMMLAVAANAFLVRWNFARTAKVNAGLLGGGGRSTGGDRVAPSGVTFRSRKRPRSGSTHAAAPTA